ncbi:MAG: arginase family protein [Candidatus Azotimanducaceae bacterium WSBS_2022_MAG_OTU7]
MDKPVLEPHHIFYLGLRDVETAEQEYLDELGIQALTNEDIEEYGVEAAVTKTLDVVTKGTDYLVLSIDLDGLDPQDAPATGTPVDKGIRLHDMVPVLTKMIETTDFDLLEIAEYNPTLDGKEQTYQTIKTLLELLISKC